MIRFIFHIAYFESNHSSSRVFGSWKFVQNLFFSYFFRLIYCIAYFESNLSSSWVFGSWKLHLNRFKLFRIDSNLLWKVLIRFRVSLILFNLHMKFFESIQNFWFYSIFMPTRISYFTLLNQFKVSLIRFKLIFSMLFWVKLGCYLIHRISLQKHSKISNLSF